MSTAFDPGPVTLEGRHVRLEPLGLEHAGDLFRAGSDASIWRYMPRPPLQSLDDTQRMIGEALAEAQRGTQVPFAIVERAGGTAIGSTRYLDIARADRRLEIGFTWITPQYQRGPVNTECKYLLLRHAFEDLGAIRVQLKTDSRNEQSQRAIERIGAVREGVLRNHMILWDGYIRHTVYYSVLDSEWPAVRQRLEQMMAR